jgi:hypothetical protein
MISYVLWNWHPVVRPAWVNRDALTTAVWCMYSVLSSASTFESQLIRDLEARRGIRQKPGSVLITSFNVSARAHSASPLCIKARG